MAFSAWKPDLDTSHLRESPYGGMGNALNMGMKIGGSLRQGMNRNQWGNFQGDITTEEGAKEAFKLAMSQGDKEGALDILEQFKRGQQKPAMDSSGEWRAAGEGQIFHSRSGEVKGAKPQLQPTDAGTSSATTPEPTKREKFEVQKSLAQKRFEEQKRLNNAKIDRLNKTPVKGMSGDAAKIKGITDTLPAEAQQLKAMIQSMGGRKFALAYKARDPKISRLVDQVADKVGRLRSGGAVNKEEEERFTRQIASWSDVAYGDDKAMLDGLDGYVNESLIVGRAMLSPGSAPADTSGFREIAPGIRVREKK